VTRSLEQSGAQFDSRGDVIRVSFHACNTEDDALRVARDWPVRRYAAGQDGERIGVIDHGAPSLLGAGPDCHDLGCVIYDQNAMKIDRQVGGVMGRLRWGAWDGSPRAPRWSV